MDKKKLIYCGIVFLFMIGAILFYFWEVLPDQKEQALRKEQVKQYYEAKYAQYQQENEAFTDYEVDVAFLGDSLTDGYDLKKYYPDLITANRGIGGETTFGLEERMKLSVYDLKPKVVVMLIGGNNLDTMFNNYESLLIGLHENLPESRIVLLSLTAMGRDWAHKNHIASYNNVKIKALAEKYDCTYIDIFTLLLDPQKDEIHSAYTNDGVHLTHEGYVVITNAITPVLKKLLSDI